MDLINPYRRANGKSALAFHPDVNRAAAWLSRDMANNNYFSHTNSNNRGMSSRLTNTSGAVTSTTTTTAGPTTTTTTRCYLTRTGRISR